MLLLRPALLLAGTTLAVGACDVFTARVPCAIDDECGAGEVCADGFCADDDGTPGREGEGEGEGEGERPVESHPLRGTICDDPGAPSIADAGLRCSVFGVFEEPCAIDDDCGDPLARFCVDPGAGPRMCAATADFTRTACPDDPDDPDAVADGNVDVPFDCFDGSLVFAPTLRCNASGTSFSGTKRLGGDFTARLNQRDDDDVFCDTLEFLSFGSLEVGGTVRIGPDPGDDGAQPTKLVAVALGDLVAIHGDTVIEDTLHITRPVFGDLRRVLGDVVLRHNVGLTDIDLFSLVEVGGDVVLENNPALDTISNTAPTRIGGDLIVRNSPLLSCAMLQPLIEATEGEVVIEGIAGPCL